MSFVSACCPCWRKRFVCVLRKSSVWTLLFHLRFRLWPPLRWLSDRFCPLSPPAPGPVCRAVLRTVLAICLVQTRRGRRL